MSSPNDPGGQYPQGGPYPQGGGQYPQGGPYPQGGGQYPQGSGPGQMPPPPGGYQAQPGQPKRTNVMAILALVFAFVFAPLGIVFGIIGRNQTRKRGEGGRGLATAGLILGIVFTLLEILFIALIIVVAVNATPTVSQSKVQSEISTTLESTGGTKPDSVQCPGELKGEEGEVLTCSTTVSGVRGEVDVTVTSVSGSTIRYSVQPNKDATPEVLQSYLESQLSSELESQVGQKPDSVKCPGDLLGKIGETITCTASIDGDSAPIEVKVTSVEGLKVAFSFEVK